MADDNVIGEGLWGAGLTPDELGEMQSKTSMWVSRVYVRPYGSMVRISLGELVEGKTNWHSSIAVSAEDLIVFSELFLTQAKFALDFEKQRAPSGQAVPAPEPGDAE